MKTPVFWYQPEGFASRTLAPLAFLYRIGGWVRRCAAKPYHAGVPVICVGNVTAGGSGKTPTALALATMLHEQGHKPVFVTRGYGGTQRGPLRVDVIHHGAEDVGDEALLLAQQAPVWIGRDRAAAIREAEKEATHVILDDGLQNPNIAPDISVLVIDAAVGIGNGQIIPAGPLREPLADALQRVSALLVIGEGGTIAWKEFQKPIFRAHFEPVLPADFPRSATFLAFAGIGRPEKFYALCRRQKLNLIATQDFADHHPFTFDELQKLEQKAGSLGAQLLTTEKDFVRLPIAFRTKVLTFPIQLHFDDSSAIAKLLHSVTTPSLPS